MYCHLEKAHGIPGQDLVVYQMSLSKFLRYAIHDGRLKFLWKTKVNFEDQDRLRRITYMQSNATSTMIEGYERMEEWLISFDGAWIKHCLCEFWKEMISKQRTTKLVYTCICSRIIQEKQIAIRRDREQVGSGTEWKFLNGSLR